MRTDGILKIWCKHDLLTGQRFGHEDDTYVRRTSLLSGENLKPPIRLCFKNTDRTSHVHCVLSPVFKGFDGMELTNAVQNW